MAKNRDGMVRLIGAFKLVKAALLIALGIGGLVAMPRDVANFAQRGLQWLGLFPGYDYLHRAVGKMWHVDESTAEKYGAAALAYAAVFVVEGVGLLRKKRWAEWMTVGVTTSFVPIEIYHLVKHFSAGKIVVLLLNIAIVGFLIWRRLEERRSVTARIARAVGVA